MEEQKLNLPAIKKGNGIKKRTSKTSLNLKLKNKSKINSIIKNKELNIQKSIYDSEKGLDLVLVGDLTGSMRNYHQLLKSKFIDLSNDLFSLIKNLRIGIIFYLDHESGDPYITKIQNLTTNTQELIHFINTTPTGCGGDEDEAVEDALNDILNNINWKQTSTKSVVIFGDASPHPVSNCPYNYDFFEITKKLFQTDTTINSVFCRNYSQNKLQSLEPTEIGDFTRRYEYLRPANFFSWIANVTGGMVVSVEKIDDLIDIIKASAAKDSGTLDDLEKEYKSIEPRKLKLIEIAKKAEQRKKLNNRKSYKMLN